MVREVYANGLRRRYGNNAEELLNLVPGGVSIDKNGNYVPGLEQYKEELNYIIKPEKDVTLLDATNNAKGYLMTPKLDNRIIENSVNFGASLGSTWNEKNVSGIELAKEKYNLWYQLLELAVNTLLAGDQTIGKIAYEAEDLTKDSLIAILAGDYSKNAWFNWRNQGKNNNNNGLVTIMKALGAPGATMYEETQKFANNMYQMQGYNIFTAIYDLRSFLIQWVINHRSDVVSTLGGGTERGYNTPIQLIYWINEAAETFYRYVSHLMWESETISQFLGEASPWIAETFWKVGSKEVGISFSEILSGFAVEPSKAGETDRETAKYGRKTVAAVMFFVAELLYVDEYASSLDYNGEYVANTAVGPLTKRLEDETVSQWMQRVRRARGKTVREFDLYYDEPEQWSQEWVKITSYGQPTVRFPLPITGPVLPKNLTDISKFESLSKYFAPSTVMVLKALREWTDGKYNKEVGSDKTELDKLESVMAQIYNKTEARHSWYRQEYIARIGETRYAPGRYETLVAAHRPEVDKITFSVVGATNRKKGFDQNYKRDAWYYNKNLKTQLSLAQKQMFQQKANGGTQELISFLNAFKILANGISFFGPVLAVIGKIVSFVLQIIMFFIDESREYVFHVYENFSLGPTIKWVGPVTEVVKKFFGQETRILHNAFDKQKDIIGPIPLIRMEKGLNKRFYSGLNSKNGYESFNDVMVRNSWEDIDSIVRSTAAQPETPSVAKPASDLSSDTTQDWWKNLPEPKKGQFMYWIF